jgi:hypothetical protein
MTPFRQDHADRCALPDLAEPSTGRTRLLSTTEVKTMKPLENDFTAFVRTLLAASERNGSTLGMPTLLVDCPLIRQKRKGVISADLAIDFFKAVGFAADRTKMNMEGYPGLLRDLNSPAPWVVVEMDNIDGPFDSERAVELTPLIDRLASEDVQNLMFNWKVNRETKCREIELLGFPISACSAEATAIMENSFRELLSLGGALRQTAFDDVWETIFDFDELSVASGSPDLLVWLPFGDPPLWFFTEVKGPGDSLRQSQIEWITKHWQVIKGHFLVTQLH